MHDNRIFSDNPKKSSEMALQRGGNDLQRTIQRELRVLRVVGLVEGDAWSGYYLPERLKTHNLETIIEQNPELNLPSPTDEQVGDIKMRIAKLAQPQNSVKRLSINEYYGKGIFRKWDNEADVGSAMTPAAYIEAYRQKLLALIKDYIPSDRNPGLIKILSIGAGTGKFEKMLSDEGYNIIAIDIFDEAIDIMKEKGLNVIKASGTDLPFSDFTFDMVLIDGTLGHLASYFEIPENAGIDLFKKPLSEAHRVLKNRGLIVISDDIPPEGIDYKLNPRVDLMRVSDRVMQVELINTNFSNISFQRIPYERPKTGLQERRVATAYKLEVDSERAEIALRSILGHALLEPVQLMFQIIFNKIGLLKATSEQTIQEIEALRNYIPEIERGLSNLRSSIKDGAITGSQVTGQLVAMKDKLLTIYKDLKDKLEGRYSANKDYIKLMDKLSELIDILQTQADFIAGNNSKDELDINALIKGSIPLITEKLMNPYIQYKGIEVNLEEGSPKVRANARLLRRILGNIISNAEEAVWKKTKEGQIVVTTKFDRLGNRILITISDNGGGVASEMLAEGMVTGRSRMFDLNASTQKTGGGLGLAEAWYVIEDIGGTIEVSSELGKGTTFIIRLPITQDAQPPRAPGVLTDVGSSAATERADNTNQPKATDSRSSSAVGGIDLSALPIITQPMNTPRINVLLSSLDNIETNPEWNEIQNMVNAGIIPSGQRIKDYLQSCCQRKELNGEIGRVLNCIADIMRIEEERVLATDQDIKSLLVLVESGKSENELVSALSRINFSPKEPESITP